MKLFKICLALSAVFVSVFADPWVATPRDEYGMGVHKRLLQQTHDHGKDVQIVFLGDSITHGWAGSGREVFAKHYGNRHVYNYGIGGDRTEHVLWRLQNKELDGMNPKVITLMIGANNINIDMPTAIARGVNAILEDIHYRFPNTKILLISVLPRQNVEQDTAVYEINKLIQRFADYERVHWLDLSVFFETSLAHEIAELYVADQIHLSAKGYELWANKMEPSLRALLAEN